MLPMLTETKKKRARLLLAAFVILTLPLALQLFLHQKTVNHQVLPSLAGPCQLNTGASCASMDCFGWRGNTTCRQGLCYCQQGSCANSKGVCVEQSSSPFVKRDFKLKPGIQDFNETTWSFAKAAGSRPRLVLADTNHATKALLIQSDTTSEEDDEDEDEEPDSCETTLELVAENLATLSVELPEDSHWPHLIILENGSIQLLVNFTNAHTAYTLWGLLSRCEKTPDFRYLCHDEQLSEVPCTHEVEPPLSAQEKVQLQSAWNAKEPALDDSTCEDKMILGPMLPLSGWPVQHVGDWVALLGAEAREKYMSIDYLLRLMVLCLTCLVFFYAPRRLIPFLVFIVFAFMRDWVLYPVCYVLCLVCMLPILSVLHLLTNPILERLQIDHMERNIMFCSHEIGFTFYSVVIYALFILHSIKSALAVEQHLLDDAWVVAGVRLGTQRRRIVLAKMVDLGTDAGTLITTYGRQPGWWSGVWAVTVLVSAVQAGLLASEESFKKHKDCSATTRVVGSLALLAAVEHLSQIALNTPLLSPTGMTNEYEVYSTCLAAAGILKLMRWACQECCVASSDVDSEPLLA